MGSKLRRRSMRATTGSRLTSPEAERVKLCHLLLFDVLSPQRYSLTKVQVELPPTSLFLQFVCSVVQKSSRRDPPRPGSPPNPDEPPTTPTRTETRRGKEEVRKKCNNRTHAVPQNTQENHNKSPWRPAVSLLDWSSLLSRATHPSLTAMTSDACRVWAN